MHNTILLYILIFLTLLCLFAQIDIKQIQNVLLYDYEIKK